MPPAAYPSIQRLRCHQRKGCLEGMSTDVVLLTALVVLPFAGSVVAALFPTNARNAEAWLAGGVALAELAIAAYFYGPIARREIPRAEFEWLPQLGLNFIL